jgi:hypothetical protein
MFYYFIKSERINKIKTILFFFDWLSPLFLLISKKNFNFNVSLSLLENIISPYSTQRGYIEQKIRRIYLIFINNNSIEKNCA